MIDELFESSLKRDDYSELKTYDISKLFYVAFLGGIIPTIVLGTKNANWLRVDKKKIGFLVILGVIVLFFKVILCSMVVAHYIEMSSRAIRWVYRVACLLFFLGYYFVMKDNLNQHKITSGDFQPILKDAVKWIIIGIASELILLSVGGYIIKNVF